MNDPTWRATAQHVTTSKVIETEFASPVEPSREVASLKLLEIAQRDRLVPTGERGATNEERLREYEYRLMGVSSVGNG